MICTTASPWQHDGKHKVARLKQHREGRYSQKETNYERTTWQGKKRVAKDRDIWRQCIRILS